MNKIKPLCGTEVIRRKSQRKLSEQFAPTLLFSCVISSWNKAPRLHPRHLDSGRWGAAPPAIPTIMKADERKHLTALHCPPRPPKRLPGCQGIAPPLPGDPRPCTDFVFSLCNLLTCLQLIVLQTALFRGDFHGKQSIFPSCIFLQIL